MNSQYKNPGIPETRMSDVENKHFRKAVSPVRGAVLCALATLFGAGRRLLCTDHLLYTAGWCIHPDST